MTAHAHLAFTEWYWLGVPKRPFTPLGFLEARSFIKNRLMDCNIYALNNAKDSLSLEKRIRIVLMGISTVNKQLYLTLYSAMSPGCSRTPDARF